MNVILLAPKGRRMTIKAAEAILAMNGLRQETCNGSSDVATSGRAARESLRRELLSSFGLSEEQAEALGQKRRNSAGDALLIADGDFDPEGERGLF